VACVVVATAKGEPDRPAPLRYAYTNATELALVEGDHVVARYAGVFMIGALLPTLDGHYVAALNGLPSNQDPYAGLVRTLVAINTETGKVRTVPCANCVHIAAVGGSRFLASLEGDQQRGVTLLIDLSSPELPTQLRTNAPALAAGPTVAIGLPDKVLAYGGGSFNGTKTLGPIQFFFITSGGTVKPTPSFGGNTSPSAVAATVRNGDGQPQIAVEGASRLKNDSCRIGGFISLVDPASGTVTLTNTSAVVASDELVGTAATATSGLIARDLWWSPDGHLYATIKTWKCDPNQQASVPAATPFTVWRLNAGRWEQVSKDPVDDMRELGDGTKAMLISPASDSPNNLNPGTLYYVDKNGTRKRIAGRVDSLTVAFAGTSG
jgi:hypothetical protein